MKLLKTVASIAVVAAMAATSAVADGHATTKLRIQTHFSPETLSGKMAAKYIEDIQAMSNGEIQVEMFYSSSVVKSVETFDAAATGILDCDMTGSGYQTGKNPAFQFAGDLLGGYLNPYQQMAWLLHGGGRDAVNNLHNGYDMEFVGWWIPGPESLASTKPIRTAADFKDWKFRSPPGLATKVFAALGASPIVMDFNEIFTALETGIIDGADAANLTNNVGLGLYDIAEHTNYPGFHSMPADHLAVTKRFGMQCLRTTRRSWKSQWTASRCTTRQSTKSRTHRLQKICAPKASIFMSGHLKIFRHTVTRFRSAGQSSRQRQKQRHFWRATSAS